MALFDAFLKINGIKGESTDSKHKGEIDVLSFNWGNAQGGSQGSGGGGGTGKVHFHDFVITKKVDKSSPTLMANCAGGNHIDEIDFVVRKAGGEQLEYLKIKLTDCLISSYKPIAARWDVPEHLLSPRAPGHAAPVVTDEVPEEEVAINFAKVEMQYQPQDKTGKAEGGPIMAGWDLKANKKV